MKKLLRIILGLGIVAMSNLSFGQQYPVFTQYYFNELVINPAYAGNHVQASFTGTHRSQWVNFPGAPKTYSFTAHTSLVNGRVGVGLLVNNDKIGSYDNQNVYTYYSYRLHLTRGVLSMGLSAGFNRLGADFSKLELVDINDPSFTAINNLKPNFGGGIMYSQKNFFVGFSVPFIINSAVTSGLDLTTISQARYYFLRSGFIKPVAGNNNFKINPSILVRAQEGQPLSMDLNTGVILYDLVSAGVSWRSGDALISFLDFKVFENFHFAYSYDWTSSGIKKHSNGSHEFMINYRAKIRSIHKELECPTYYNYGTSGGRTKRNNRFNMKKSRN
jgi:type IX secretion system PorP/SprF family membrane protein